MISVVYGVHNLVPYFSVMYSGQVSNYLIGLKTRAGSYYPSMNLPNHVHLLIYSDTLIARLGVVCLEFVGHVIRTDQFQVIPCISTGLRSANFSTVWPPYKIIEAGVTSVQSVLRHDIDRIA